MKRSHAAGKPFFLYLPFSMGHCPNLPSKEFAGKSRIGQYGDKMMEGDYPRRRNPRCAEGPRVDDDTILMFASDNGPQGETAREIGNHGTPDMGSPVRSAANSAKRPKARSGPSLSFDGPAT